MICDFCKKQGHIKEKCYKLHGYPPKNNTLNSRTNNAQQSNAQQYRQNNNQNFRGRRIIANAHGEECSQQNNIVEGKHRYLLETARALLFQSKLPTKYWGDCILTSTYIINRLPSTFLQNKCPYEMLYKEKPKYNQLRSFGWLCYPTSFWNQRVQGNESCHKEDTNLKRCDFS